MSQCITISDEDEADDTRHKQTQKKRKARRAGMSPFKRKSTWIASSFCEFEGISNIQKPTPKASKFSKNDMKKVNSGCTETKSSGPEMTVPWVEKYKPLSEVELAVHKKKVSEIRDWLCQSLSQKRGGILLLSGPAGSGKTAALQYLCSELGIEIQEWVNPEVQTRLEYAANRNYELMWGESQTKQFQDFLFRANRYSGITGVSNSSADDSGHSKRVICIEELPTFIDRDVTIFQDMLRQYKRTSRNPLVFVMSDSFSDTNNLYSIFPKHFQLELKISKVSFNPVSMTNLLKTMVRIATKEHRQNPKSIKNPTKNDLDLLATSSNGDIRAAINALQFTCTKGTVSSSSDSLFTSISRNSQKSAKSVKEKEYTASTDRKQPSADSKKHDTTVLIGGRDTSLFLFRALGKILYCKRETNTRTEESNILPSHLHHCARDRLLINPDEIVERTRISGETVNLYLHQNFPDFYNDISNLADALEFFSDADQITGSWVSRQSMSAYSAVIVPRAVAFYSDYKSSTTVTSTSAWRPLHKPQWFEVHREVTSHCNAVQHLFRGFRHPGLQLQTELLPFLAKINAPLENPSQISLLQTLTTYSYDRSTTRNFPELLGDSEVTLADACAVDIQSSHRTHSSDNLKSFDTTSTKDAEDDIIEDFDSDGAC